MADRRFNLWPDGVIEEIDAEGDTYRLPPAPGLFDKVVKAGFPAIDSGVWTGLVHLRVQNGELVFANVGRIDDKVQALPAGAELFFSWLRQAGVLPEVANQPVTATAPMKKGPSHG